MPRDAWHRTAWLRAAMPRHAVRYIALRCCALQLNATNALLQFFSARCFAAQRVAQPCLVSRRGALLRTVALCRARPCNAAQRNVALLKVYRRADAHRRTVLCIAELRCAWLRAARLRCAVLRNAVRCVALQLNASF